MKKNFLRLTSVLLAAAMVVALPVATYATEAVEGENGDNVVIEEDDKPYLSLGADLSDGQEKTVLSLMGIDEDELESYDVSYVTNDEEHEYLDDYIPSSEIGTKSLSSVIITEANEGDGINISTYNINYCTVGMYKNACATAGVKDANIIVAAPFSISGTAALLGIFKAYEQMSGEELSDEVIDAAMNELVTTGELNESIDGDDEDVEAFIADLKEQIANGGLENEADISAAIDKTAEKYGLKLTADDKQKVLDLLTKLKSLDLDWASIADQAKSWANKIGDLDIDTDSLAAKIKAFFSKFVEIIKSFFS